jgi:hypothetical protein
MRVHRLNKNLGVFFELFPKFDWRHRLTEVSVVDFLIHGRVLKLNTLPHVSQLNRRRPFPTHLLCLV